MHMESFWDILFPPMKHSTNHFTCCVSIFVQYNIIIIIWPNTLSIFNWLLLSSPTVLISYFTSKMWNTPCSMFAHIKHPHVRGSSIQPNHLGREQCSGRRAGSSTGWPSEVNMSHHVQDVEEALVILSYATGLVNKLLDVNGMEILISSNGQ